MLGFFRYVLAFMVVFSHFWGEILWWQGGYAVFCFYVISGYLMSMVLNEVYINNYGPLRYMGNRALRIYPLYLLALALTILVIPVFPEVNAIRIDGGEPMSIFMWRPEEPMEWVRNITLLFPASGKLTVTQGWSLQIEMIFYFLMIFLARNARIVYIWFAASLVYIIYLDYIEAPYFHRYYTVMGASIAFSAGAVVYRIRKQFRLGRAHVYVATVLFFCHLWFAPDIWAFHRRSEGFGSLFKSHHYGIYGCVLLSAYLLMAIVSNDFKSRANDIGTCLGELAYAVFLIHWVIGITVAGLGVPFDNKLAFISITFVLINLVSLFLYWSFESPINNRIRRVLRQGSSSKVGG